MFVLTICGFFTVLLSLPFFNKNKPYGLRLGFLVLTIMSAIRYDYGNDYWAYYDVFESILYSNFTLLDLLDVKMMISDPGWSVLCYIFKPLGFNGFIACISVFVNFCYYKFIRTYVPVNYYAMAAFLYVFDWSIFPVQLSMLRQSIAICVFIIIFKYIIEKKVIKAFIIILIASTIHKSIIIITPFVLLGYVSEKWIKQICLMTIISFVVVLFASSYVNSLYSYFIVLEAFEKYSYAEKYSDSQIGIRTLIHTLPSIYTCFLLYNKKIEIDRTNKFLLLIPCIGIVFIPFNQISVIIGRLSFYFNTFTVVAYPQIWINSKSLLIKISLAFVILIVMLFEYISFFNSDIYGDSFYIYHTIFD